MSLANISLKDYDNVVAVTQVAINQTMGEYLMAHPTNIALYGKEDDDGNVTLVPDAKDATYSFTGTLAPEKVNGVWLNLVQLHTDKGNQTVQYNVTFKNGEFTVLATNKAYKQNSNTPWVIGFFVKLAMQDVAKSDLPDDLKRKLQNVDENMFSIQQLYMDLNTAALASSESIKMPSVTKSAMADMVKGYLIQQQTQNKPLFGVTVKFKDKTVPPPTLTPTYVNFCVTPYHDADGKTTNPNLDTLNYLVMTNHNQPPNAYPPDSFPFNWVDDVNTHGALAIKGKAAADFIVQQLNPILKGLCPVVYCKADKTKPSPNDLVIKLNPGVDHVFNRAFDLSTGKIASYSYQSPSGSDYYSDAGVWGYSNDEVSADYGMSCDIFIIKDKMRIAGSITSSARVISSITMSGDRDPRLPPPNDTRYNIKDEMPNTTYKWFVELQLYMDAASNGQLDFKVIAQDFNSQPTVENKDESWWDNSYARFGFSLKTYTTNLGDLRGQVKGHIMGNVLSDLKGVLTRSQHFIFPGAKTFTYKNPTFSDSLDIASNITYLNPNA